MRTYSFITAEYLRDIMVLTFEILELTAVFGVFWKYMYLYLTVLQLPFLYIHIVSMYKVNTQYVQ